MSKKNETLPLVLALLITLLLLGGGLWWLGRRFVGLGGGSPVSSDSSIPLDATALQARFSTGERGLVPPGSPNNSQAQKQAGIEAIAAGNLPQAITAFESALALRKNDPEALIYLNNARIGTQKSYMIAVTVPLDTDVDASLEMLRGVAQAQDEVNRRGGIANVPLKVLIVNDGGTPDRARQVAAMLVETPEVLGVVGHYTSDMSLAAGEIYNQGNLVMISPVSTSVKLSNFGRSIFRTVPSDFVSARSLANYMLTQLQQQKAAVFYNSQSGYSQSLKSEFTSALALGGGQVISEFDLSSPSFNAADSYKQVTQQQAGALVLLPNSGQLDRALQVVQVNRQRLKMLAGDDVYAPKTLAVGGVAAQGMIVAVPWHILANQQTPFVQNSRVLWGADVNWRTATSYDAAIALITALGSQPDRQGVQAALANGNFAATGASGPVRFLPSGDRNQSVQLVEIQAGSRAGYDVEFSPIP